MKVTPEITRAIEAASERLGSGRQLALAAGLSPNDVCRYLQGKVKTITDDKWARLEPHLRRYLPRPPGAALTPDEEALLALYRAAPEAGRLQIREAAAGYFVHPPPAGTAGPDVERK